MRTTSHSFLALPLPLPLPPPGPRRTAGFPSNRRGICGLVQGGVVAGRTYFFRVENAVQASGGNYVLKVSVTPDDSALTLF